jgi:hypothetical protein
VRIEWDSWFGAAIGTLFRKIYMEAYVAQWSRWTLMLATRILLGIEEQRSGLQRNCTRYISIGCSRVTMSEIET